MVPSNFLSSLLASTRNALAAFPERVIPRVDLMERGSMKPWFVRMARCKCGPVDRPVVPT